MLTRRPAVKDTGEPVVGMASGQWMVVVTELTLLWLNLGKCRTSWRMGATSRTEGHNAKGTHRGILVLGM